MLFEKGSSDFLNLSQPIQVTSISNIPPNNQLQQVGLVGQVDTKHEGMIHDAQYDYFGQKLATGSSDGKVIIYDVSQLQNHKKIGTIEAHQCPIWQIRWCHPRYGNYLATCSFDKHVIVWAETNSTWQKATNFPKLDSSVNCIEWCPQQFGLKLAAGSADGKITLFQKVDYDDEWDKPISWNAHNGSVNSLSWVPICSLTDLKSKNTTETYNLILATGGNDYQLIIWNINLNTNEFEKKLTIKNDGWVRSVQFSPLCEEKQRILAIASENGIVKIIVLCINTFEIKKENIIKFDSFACWKVSWSPMGNQIAVTCGSIQSNETSVQVFQQSFNGDYVEIQRH